MTEPATKANPYDDHTLGIICYLAFEQINCKERGGIVVRLFDRDMPFSFGFF
jgi:hypothetical protein